MATIADLRKSRQTLELQAQQLAELAETLSRAEGRSRERQSRQIRFPRQYEP